MLCSKMCQVVTMTGVFTLFLGMVCCWDCTPPPGKQMSFKLYTRQNNGYCLKFTVFGKMEPIPGFDPKKRMDIITHGNHASGDAKYIAFGRKYSLQQSDMNIVIVNYPVCIRTIFTASPDKKCTKHRNEMSKELAAMVQQMLALGVNPWKMQLVGWGTGDTVANKASASLMKTNNAYIYNIGSFPEPRENVV